MGKQIRKLRVSPQELDEIKQRYRETGKARVSRRLTCLLMKSRGHTHEQVAEVLLVTVDTVSRWLRLYQEEGLDAFCAYHWRGDPGELSEPQLAALTAELRRQTYRNARHVRDYLEATFGVAYSVRAVQELLRRLGFSYHKSALVSSRADPEAQAAFVKDYFELREELGEGGLGFFVDAAHLVHNVLPGYGWAPVGEAPIFPTNSGRDRLSVLGAYSPRLAEYVGLETKENINAESMKQLADKLVAAHPECERIVLIVDNAKYNHARLLKEHLAGTAVELKHLPAYSPNLNLIERLWNWLKEEVMRDHFHETFAEFVAAVKDFLAALPSQREKLRRLLSERFHIPVLA
jgi:transposase